MCRTLLLVLLMLILPSTSYAQDLNREPTGACTYDRAFEIPEELLAPGTGLISSMLLDIQYAINSASYTMYSNIAGSSDFADMVGTALTLYMVIYGILFTFGMLQQTIFDFFTRLIKVGIVVGFVSAGSGWADYLFNIIYYFFEDGTNAIISEVTAIAIGVSSAPSEPFAVMDGVLAKIISAKMLVTLLAIIFTGPYGLIFGLLLVLSLGSFLKALIQTAWVYIMAMVLRALLIAVSPIFILCILFERTRHLFTAWLGQLINTCLQPIMLVMFFAFFAALIGIAIDGLMAREVCYTFVPEAWRGGPTNLFWWRFAEVGDDGNWHPFSGAWDFEGSLDGASDGQFPINIIQILIFFLLSELAGRFNSVVLMVSNDLSGASVNLTTMQTPLSDWFSPISKPESPISERSGPGGRDKAGPLSESLRQGDGNKTLKAMGDTLASEGPIAAIKQAFGNMSNKPKSPS